MAKLLTTQDMIEGHLDTQTLKEAVNEDKMVTSRLGKEYASLPMASRLLVENGLLGATPFSTYAAMAASALVDGDYAVVTNDPVQANNGIYEMRDGELIKSRYNIPLFSYLLAERDEAHGETGLAIEFADADGKVFFGFDGQGRCHADFVLGERLSDTTETHAGGAVVALTDDDGNFVAGFDGKGALVVNDVRSLLAQNAHADAYHAQRLTDNLTQFVADLDAIGLKHYLKRQDTQSIIASTPHKIEFIHEGGQSNSIGGGAYDMPDGQQTYTKTNIHPHNCLMLNTGARGAMDTPINPDDITDFAPIAEVFEQSRGETHGSGLTFALYEQNAQRRLSDKCYIYRTNGRGGTAISDLSKGSTMPMYQNGIIEVQKAIEIAQNYGKQIVMRAFFWTQGEQDRSDWTSRADYAQMLTQYMTDYKSDIEPLLPSDNPPLTLVINQLCAPKNGATRGLIHLAQYDVFNSQAYCTISTPTYIFEWGGSQTVHFTPQANAIIGEYMAKAYHALEQGHPWSPTHPTEFEATANQIIITFYTPVGGLQFNLSHRTKAQNYGFEYEDDAGNAITDVQIINSQQVAITLSGDIGANAVVAYARSQAVDNVALDVPYSGVWGNLSDSDTTQSINDTNFTLANYCVSFDHAIN